MEKINIEEFKRKVQERIKNKGTAKQKRNETTKEKTSKIKTS